MATTGNPTRSRSFALRVALGYAVLSLAVFATIFHVLGVRELTLALLQWGINLPMSLPLSRAVSGVAESFLLRPGGASYCWTYQLVMTVANAALLGLMVGVAQRLARARRAAVREVGRAPDQPVSRL